MPVGDAAFEKAVMDRVMEMDDAFRKGLQEQWKGIPTGFENVSDTVWAAEFERKEYEAGWGTVTDPKTGASMFVNLFTFALALDTVEGGKATLARYVRVRGKGTAAPAGGA